MSKNLSYSAARHSSSRALTASAGLIMALTILSRPFGIIREAVNAAYFGTRAELDIFLLATSIPIFLCTILGGGLAQSVVPGLSLAVESDDNKKWELLTRLAIWTFCLSCLIAFVNYLAAPFVIPLLFPPEMNKAALRMGVRGYRLMTPALIGGMLSGLFVGAANVFHCYRHTTLRSIAYNSMIILAVLLFYSRLGVFSLGVGILAAEFSQLLVVLPPVAARGFIFQSPTEEIRPHSLLVLNAFIPAVLLAGAAQANYLVDQKLALPLGEGCVSSLNYAWRLILLPATLLGVAFSTPLLSFLSREEARQNRAAAGRLFSQTVAMLVFFSIPITFFILMTCRDIISILYAWGRFGEKGIILTSMALFFYTPGLPFQLLQPLCVAAFLAIKKPWIPVFVSLPLVPLNWLLDRTMMIIFAGNRIFAHAGIALATSLIFVINVTLLYILLRRYLKTDERLELLGKHTAFLFCVALLFASVWQVYTLGQGVAPRTRGIILCEILSAGTLTLGGYMLLAHAFQIKILDSLADLRGRVSNDLEV
ncbi:MAG TPA: murein biosynthesis integral membrane protein MurJ [Candidatus Sumerlaeota bacterium]|nr:MAG: putative peptidoglycan biosynthesis protein MurJ [candidate division BRC1 bacterium ADurb.Bin183]HOE64082.1 murein biosynthesis integral membrane protein MurJ [Candidatus Sumerlaeota bacterium]HRR30538.1 murein biosynthesis integral membrane protein MurJ [Candidatus Sumerlaeia bacterium]HON49025.1 murein biosynthesis integral membrane protein MurJ [Candidatus Sumerlaeota bacterium]HOR64367.1 murein biosynthesis integral membrane protein MurJ [Candidatus Sumerlaeota bacterium]